ncbi:MAG: cytochrome B [Acidobacteria bacterium]|nr:MAG: cytochrome B [Acidobacteriota bacterium]
MTGPLRTPRRLAVAAIAVFSLCAPAPVLAGNDAPAAGDETPEAIGAESCLGCHEETEVGQDIAAALSHSQHAELECTDCHQDKNTFPHDPATGFRVGLDGCGTCHLEPAETYTRHGICQVDTCPDAPTCATCHGGHEVLPATDRASRIHPANLPKTCGQCHADLNLTRRYRILFATAVEVYEASVHGHAAAGGIYFAASCNDCHSSNGSSHRILPPSDPESTINFFNIPKTCGQCHKSIEQDYWEGIHGQIVKHGETDPPVCTTCHGEHGILRSDDPRSPVSRQKLAEQTCARCHESARLNEKYGLASGRLASFIDSYHGLKTEAGDTRVANCASCHGAHRILPSSDPGSSINPQNLPETCGQCHPGISPALAETPIHGVGGTGLHTPLAELVQRVYIWLIVVTIGLMLAHVTLDWLSAVRRRLRARPQVLRMRLGELWQHSLLMISFIVLVVTGFALRFDEAWFSRLLFGWERGFETRGTIHRAAAAVFMLTTVWHLLYVLLTARGRQFVRDVMFSRRDLRDLAHRIAFALGRTKEPPRLSRFSYVEKAEYWALVWGTVVMVITGLLLWFDNELVRFLPRGTLDVALMIHYWEAWLATLAILVWHMYWTVFNPAVYPMNPAWLSGWMPEEMYAHEHPEDLERARRESEEYSRERLRRLGRDRFAGPEPPGEDRFSGS